MSHCVKIGEKTKLRKEDSALDGSHRDKAEGGCSVKKKKKLQINIKSYEYVRMMDCICVHVHTYDQGYEHVGLLFKSPLCKSPRWTNQPLLPE